MVWFPEHRAPCLRSRHGRSSNTIRRRITRRIIRRSRRSRSGRLLARIRVTLLRIPASRALVLLLHSSSGRIRRTSTSTRLLLHMLRHLSCRSRVPRRGCPAPALRRSHTTTSISIPASRQHVTPDSKDLSLRSRLLGGESYIRDPAVSPRLHTGMGKARTATGCPRTRTEVRPGIPLAVTTEPGDPGRHPAAPHRIKR